MGFALALAACAPAPGASNAPTPERTGAERGYAPPPAVVSAARLSERRTLLTGVAPPGSRVRLASPTGGAIFAAADAKGAWKLVLPPADGVRLFGLSAPVEGRVVQAEGYLAVTPRGEAVQLRAGAGADVLGRAGPGLGFLAADFDRKGGAVLSGYAPARAAVVIAVDGVMRGSAAADAAGRFSLSLNKPLSAGAHVISASAGGSTSQSPVVVSVAETLTAGPFRASPTPAGWRVDWLTPGGGVQSTVLFEPAGLPR